MGLRKLFSETKGAAAVVMAIVILTTGVAGTGQAAERCVSQFLQNQEASPGPRGQGCCCCGHGDDQKVKSECDPGLGKGCSPKTDDRAVSVSLSDTTVVKMATNQSLIHAVMTESRRLQVLEEPPYRGDPYLTNLNLLC
jgi:hypothetical protein